MRSARDLYAASRRPRPEVLCFADPGFRRLAYWTFDLVAPVEPMEVTLGPSRRVRMPIVGEFAVPGPHTRLASNIAIAPWPDSPGRSWILIRRQIDPRRLAEGLVVEEELPAGAYEITASLTEGADIGPGVEIGKASGEMVVSAGEGPLELGPLELESAEEFRELIGKPAPEIEAIDLDSGRPVTLAEFRGKVVVLDFWGYWCGSCTVNMPRLMDLRRGYEGRPLAIVAFHDQSVQSRAEYDRKIEMVRQRLWGGRDLPFRVVLDRPDPTYRDDPNVMGHGATIRRYGVRGYPTLLVIDRDGTLVARVKHGEHDRLESLVRDLVEEAESR